MSQRARASCGDTDLRFRATAGAVRAALAEARSGWHRAGVARSLCDSAELVLAEVLNNIVEHAQAGRTQGRVELRIMPENGGMVCTIRDDGAPMPGGSLPQGGVAKIGDRLEDLPEGGFGWFLIRSLTEDLAYCRRDGWNHLRFRIAAD